MVAQYRFARTEHSSFPAFSGGSAGTDAGGRQGGQPHPTSLMGRQMLACFESIRRERGTCFRTGQAQLSLFYFLTG